MMHTEESYRAYWAALTGVPQHYVPEVLRGTGPVGVGQRVRSLRGFAVGGSVHELGKGGLFTVDWDDNGVSVESVDDEGRIWERVR